MVILAGDIGGTKTHLALYKEGDGWECLHQEKYPSQEYASFAEIVHLFLSTRQDKVQKVCFGIAGTIQQGKGQPTNLPWTIDAHDLKEELKTEAVWLINDLEANAWGIPCLSKEEFITLNEGEVSERGNAALISAGTGLGEAGMYWDGKIHHPFASEGGHVDFAPLDEMEMELLRYLKKKFNRVSYERILSGNGIYNLYRFLIDLRLEQDEEGIEKEFAAGKPAKIITEKALKKENKACVRAVEWFVSIYGSAAGNLALKFLARDGIFIGGGIAPKIVTVFQSGIFMKSFLAKGRLSPMLAKIPVKIILNENTALLGAARYAKQAHISE